MRLPASDPAFRWSDEAWGLALRCRPLEPVAQHLFTTKQLALRVPAPPDGAGVSRLESSAAAWTQAAAALGASLPQVMTVHQVHGRGIRVLRQGAVGPGACDEHPEADAIVSNVTGLVLAVKVADCVPVLIADPETGAAGAVHAGWRGTCARVVDAAIDAMAREFGSRPRDLFVALGPSIGPCCYEVGGELLVAFRAAGFDESRLARWFTAAPSGSLVLDVALANRDQIHEAGVPRDRIHDVRLCTRTHASLFASYRAEGPAAGRMAGLIRVPGPRTALPRAGS